MSPYQRAHDLLQAEFGDHCFGYNVYDRLLIVMARAITEAEQRGIEKAHVFADGTPATLEDFVDREG